MNIPQFYLINSVLLSKKNLSAMKKKYQYDQHRMGNKYQLHPPYKELIQYWLRKNRIGELMRVESIKNGYVVYYKFYPRRGIGAPINYIY